MPMVQTIDPFRLKVNGETLDVDYSTFTLLERRDARVALSQLSDGNDLVPDETEYTAALVWVVLRRSTPDLAFDDVLESLTIGDLADAEPIMAADLEDRDDDPEA